MKTTVIIGAGIVGLHAAHICAQKGHQVYVLEQTKFLGEHTSSRNSGVIHSGIFYPYGSFKEKICIEGNRLTYDWLKKLKVEHHRCGKWVVAGPGQENDLDAFFDKVKRLPIGTPLMKSADEVLKEEPLLRPTRAIFIPSSGILDAAGYLKALSAFLEHEGVNIVLNCQVHGFHKNTLITNRGDISFDLAINCAGLFSDAVADMTGLHDYAIKPCRGDYYMMNKCPLNRPVYHLPYQSTEGLGVHLTPTLDKQTLIGPNHYFIDDKKDYSPHSKNQEFLDALQYFLPNIDMHELTVGSSGNRPKLFKSGKPFPEFTFEKTDNWIHVLGIDSPGLTAAPALAKHLKTLL